MKVKLHCWILSVGTGHLAERGEQPEIHHQFNCIKLLSAQISKFIFFRIYAE